VYREKRNARDCVIGVFDGKGYTAVMAQYAITTARRMKVSRG